MLHKGPEPGQPHVEIHKPNDRTLDRLASANVHAEANQRTAENENRF